MALYSYGRLKLWPYMVMVLYSYGRLKLWPYIVMVLYSYGLLKLWPYIIMGTVGSALDHGRVFLIIINFFIFI